MRKILLIATLFSSSFSNADLVIPEILGPEDKTPLALQAVKRLGDSQTESKTSRLLGGGDGMIERLSVVASTTVKNFTQTGRASWYGRQFQGRQTASGERFNMHEMTAAHPTLPLNCFIKVTNKSNGKSVVVKVNDRGPFHSNRVLDLSYGAAKKIGIVDMGVANVELEVVNNPDRKN